MKYKTTKEKILYKPKINKKTIVKEVQYAYKYNELFNDMNEIQLPQDICPVVILGDVIKALKKIPSESISCIVTSPPYWQMRDYYNENQIGQEKIQEEYVSKLVEISKELLRILKKNGAYFLNIGDSYVDKGLQMIPQQIALKMIKGVKIFGRNHKRIGWLLRNQIVWYKPNHMPSPVKCRFTNTYEPVFFFTRDDWEKKVYFNLDAVRVPYKSSEKEYVFDLPEYLSEEEYEKMLPKLEEMNKKIKYNGKFKDNEKNVGASPGGRASITGIRYIKKRKTELSQEIVCNYLRKARDKKGISVKEIDQLLNYKHTAGHWFRKDAGGSLPNANDWIKLKKILEFDNRYDKEMTEIRYVLQTIKKHPKGKNPGDLWEIKTEKLSEKHFSIFPEELPKRAILSCCPPNGIVLDPFAGSGTTGKVAKELGRKSVLIELQPKFLNIIRKRCGEIRVINLNEECNIYESERNRTVGV